MLTSLDITVNYLIGGSIVLIVSVVLHFFHGVFGVCADIIVFMSTVLHRLVSIAVRNFASSTQHILHKNQQFCSNNIGIARTFRRKMSGKVLEKPKIVFVLGAPGSGKGTQCANIVHEYNYVHLSAGDLLRAERNRPGSELAQTIEEYIQAGRIIPVAITCSLIERAMNEQMQVGCLKHIFLFGFFLWSLAKICVFRMKM